MAITKDVGRQYPLFAYVDFAWDDFTASGTIEPALDIPGGAVIVGGDITILTAFDSVTSDTLTVGIVGGDEDLLEASVDGQAAARSALVLTGIATTVPTVIGITWTQVGGSTSAGAGRLRVEYIMDGRSNEVQPV